MPRPFRGFTLVELLLVTAIVGVLVSMLLFAVLKSRESSRRISCANRQHNISIAFQNFTARNGKYPAVSRRMATQYGSLSHFLYILPDLEVNEYIDIDMPNHDGLTIARLQASKSPQVLRCPSDPFAMTGGASYPVSCGVAGSLIDPNEVSQLPDDFQNAYANLVGPIELEGSDPAQIRDGLSQTILFSERLCASGTDTPTGVQRRISSDLALTSQLSVDEFVALHYKPNRTVAFCQSLATNEYYMRMGLEWYDLRCNHYNHLVTPNSYLSDCGSLRRPIVGSIAARSNHANGVNVAWCDGRVSFIADTIELSAWRAIATRHGGEIQNISE